MRVIRDLDPATIDIGMLPTLGRDQIHDLWRRLHRKSPPKGLAGELLVRALAWRIQSERQGGLARSVEQRLARAAREALRNAAGGNDAADRRLHEGVGSDGPDASTAMEPLSSTPSSSVRRSLRPGTRLVREWQGQVHEVTVLPEGFLWDGRPHRSLSVIARAITGTSWNGWLFFGVNRKSGKAASLNRSSNPSSKNMKQDAPLTSPSTMVERNGEEVFHG